MEYVYPEFVQLRPVFVALTIASLVILFIVIFQKNNLMNLFSVTSISLLSVCISAITLYSSGNIVDEFNLAGDIVSSYLFLIIAGLSFINPLIFAFKKNSSY